MNQKNTTSMNNWLLIENFHNGLYINETWSKWSPLVLVILTNFHYDRTEINIIKQYWISDLCPVHLPGQNIFCPWQNIFCPRQKFCPWLEISFLKAKMIFKLWTKFLSWTKNVLSWTKLFCLGQIWFCPGQKIFCLGRWTGHYSFIVPLWIWK